ncbi:la-related protein 7 [Sergentomyia squamirostris]
MEEEKLSSTKRARSRKKQMFNNIRKQMEFYFSDANITKDRFLGQLVMEDPFVPLEVFLSFNRMKQLTDSTKDIVKSLSKSSLLELSEDEKKVRRKSKINWNIDSDASTIYVEGLPLKADHEWVKSVFSTHGNVVYVSLPKYSGSNRIKQFGFIEFDGVGSVEKALKAFRKSGGVLSNEMNPAELRSVVTFNQEQQGKTEEVEEDDEEGLESAREEEAEEPSAKRQKLEEEPEKLPESGAEEEKPEESGKDAKKSHKRKRHKSKKSSTVERDHLFDLKIMSKKEWKRLRNKYLNLQREKFKEAKMMLQGSNGSKPVAKSPSVSITKSPKNINFYGDSAQAKPADPESGISLVKGLIVEIKLREPLVDVKDFKGELRQFECVKYVDAKEGMSVVHVRLDAPESAEELISRFTDADRTASVLSGEAEEIYWQKISQDREAKLKKVVKIEKPKRGREKLKKKINNHIFFEEDEDKVNP